MTDRLTNKPYSIGPRLCGSNQTLPLDPRISKIQNYDVSLHGIDMINELMAC